MAPTDGRVAKPERWWTAAAVPQGCARLCRAASKTVWHWSGDTP